MDRTEKAEAVSSLNATLSSAASVVVVRNLGLTVAQSTVLRQQMRDAGADFRVTKNRLAKIALDGTSYTGIGDLLTGPTALATSTDPVAAAKIAVDFAKTNDKIVYEVHKSWSIHVDSWTNPPRPGLAVLRYEDMLNNPIKTFGGLTQFLGLNPPRKRLERAIERASFKTLRRQEDERGFKEKSPFAQKFFREGRAGQWRELLTPPQIDKLVGQHKEQMQRFGYWPLR